MVQTHSGLSARLLSLILVLLSISLSLTVISELARPVTATSGSAAKITTTQDQTLYESSFQNFGFYAQGRYWVFYEDTAVNCEGMGGCLFYTSSTDGISWTTPVNVGIHVTDSDWSITTDGTHTFYVRYDENWFDSFCNRALLFGTGSLSTDGTIAWQPEQVVRSPDPLLRLPNDIIRVDSNGQAWIGYQEVNASGCGGTGIQTPHIIHSSGTNYSVWTGDYVLSTQYSNNWEVDIATLSGSSVYAIYWIDSLELHGAMFNGTSWGPDEQVSLPSESTDVNSFVFASGTNVYAIWYDSNKEMLRFGARQPSGQWSTNNIGNGEAKSASSLGRYSLPITSTFDPASSQFYVYWYNATNRSIDQWYGSTNAWTKTTAAFTTASAVGEYTISSFYETAQVGNSYSLGVMWVDQTSSPYNLNFGQVQTSPQPQTGGGTGKYFDHVVIVIMENEGVQNICGGNPPPCHGANSTYLSSLANSYAISSQYTSINPGGSQPNYIALIGGSTFNCSEESCPTMSAPNLVDRIESSGLTWKAYMENQALQTGCDTKTTLLYEYQHNPFTSFADILNNAARCSNMVLANPSGCSVTDCALIDDLNSGSAPNFMWLTPNDCNNMHGAANNSTFVCSSSTSIGDNYLSGLAPNILSSVAFTTQRSALFVVFDEGTNYCPLNGAHEDCVYAVWAGPETKSSFVSSNLYNHYSFLRTVEANWNLPSLTSNDASATPMTEFFTNNATTSPPTASFSHSPTSPQAGQTITFTGSASGGTLPYFYSWSFGDSSTGTGSSTTHSYQTAGDYSVVLNVKDSSGQTTSATQTVTVSSTPPTLTASLSFSPSSPQTDQQVIFTASASGGTSPYIFSWNFGDGTTGTGSTVNHSYSSAGTFTVVLTVNDSSSPHQTAAFQQTLTVSNPPPPLPLSTSFSYTPNSPEMNSAVTFTATVSGGTEPYAFSWNFGDGTSATVNPASHAYASTGSFTVTITVSDANGAAANHSQVVTVAASPTVSLTYGPSSPEANSPITFTASTTGGAGPFAFSWAFGDGGTSKANPVSHTYSTAGSFNVIVTVTDADGAVASSSQTITTARALTVSFAESPATPEVGQSVSFTVTSTGGVGSVTFTWTFGDGSSVTTNPATHVYTLSGSFTVSVTAVDSNRVSVTSSQILTVVPAVTASLTYAPSQPDSGQTVSFTGSANGGVRPYSYSWNFGDSGTGSGSSATHTYQSSGIYTAVLAITDANGVVAQASQTITVNPPLSASFSYSPSSPLPLLPVQFTANAAGGSQPYSYSWNFGDGWTATGATVSHSYLLPGTYTVTLTVTDANGQTTTASMTVNVSVPILGGPLGL